MNAKCAFCNMEIQGKGFKVEDHEYCEECVQMIDEVWLNLENKHKKKQNGN
jgi:hypothetical protein